MLNRATRLTKRAVRKALNIFGIDAFLRKPGHAYVPDFYGPSARKQVDIRTSPGFGALANATVREGRSCLYYDRLHVIYQSLLNLRPFSGSGNDVNLCEIGVCEGGTSHFIASAIEALNLEQATLHSFDTFEGHPARDVQPELDTFHRAGGLNRATYEEVGKYLQEFDNLELFKGRFQDNCHKIESKKFHFVHLDVDIHEPTSFALNFFDSRLVPGGIIVIDDYGFVTCSGVKKAVDDFVDGNDRYFFLPSLTGQGLLVRCR